MNEDYKEGLTHVIICVNVSFKRDHIERKRKSRCSSKRNPNFLYWSKHLTG